MNQSAAAFTSPPPSDTASDATLTHLRHLIEHATHLLPAQGPITGFVHHNTLHAFEELPFDEAVKRAARVFGCHPYLTEDRYRTELQHGRIRFTELREVLVDDLGPRGAESVPPGGTRLELRLAMLQFAQWYGPTEELLWFVAETDALRRVRRDASAATRARLVAETRRWVMRDLRGGDERDATAQRPGRGSRNGLAPVFERLGESTIESWDEAAWEAFTLQALWRICCDGATSAPTSAPPPSGPSRHRDLLFEAAGADADLLVHELLIPFCAAFLDQGFAQWPLPAREEGLYAAFVALFRQGGGTPDRWMRDLPRLVTRLIAENVGPLESIRESLVLLGVHENEWAAFLSATLLALRGWAGMVRQIEERGDRVVQPVPAGSLIDFVAVRLLLERLALAHLGRETLGYDGPLDGLREAARRHIEPQAPPSVEQRAFAVFQLAQVLGWTPEELHHLGPQQWASLLDEVEAFSGLERRRVFHMAYERRFNTQTLDALALHAHHPAPTPRRPRFQATFCLDDREESLRRHVEELAPDAETFGIAGFYFVAMYYKGADDAHFGPLCPVVMRPAHWVVEQAEGDDAMRRARTRRALGLASHQFQLGSRSFAVGALLATAVGVLATIPLVVGTLFPRLTARLRRTFGRLVPAAPATHLKLERTEAAPGPMNGHVGFSLDEMTASAERVLRDLGLTVNFARLVVVLGHGSTSMNNPHESAYDCGACGGARSGPNGRAMAQILNDPRVRAELLCRGLVIPDETAFVGGWHNTSNDTVTLFDLDRVPANHRDDLDYVRSVFTQACARDAHERCRRFQSAPLTLSFAHAHQHVEGRSEDLAQVRPELGHATNAISIIGRRHFTRGLFLDRRAFLTSYDPTQDDAELSLLQRILLAVFPVCAGISLEYYFSSVDNTGYGSGTKLPHNVTAMLGVMDGAASDLRTGLPWQMVEIHEPMRLLNVIETTPEAMLRILERNAGIARLVRNGWCHLAVIHPETRAVSVYRDGAFHIYQPRATHLPRAASSIDWYRGWRDHLEFAAIG